MSWLFNKNDRDDNIHVWIKFFAVAFAIYATSCWFLNKYWGGLDFMWYETWFWIWTILIAPISVIYRESILENRHSFLGFTYSLKKGFRVVSFGIPPKTSKLSFQSGFSLIIITITLLLAYLFRLSQVLTVDLQTLFFGDVINSYNLNFKFFEILFGNTKNLGATKSAKPIISEMVIEAQLFPNEVEMSKSSTPDFWKTIYDVIGIFNFGTIILACLAHCFFIDGVTLWLIWLIVVIFFVISLGFEKKFAEKTSVLGDFKMYYEILNVVLLLMVVCFSVKNIFIFFISFEVILIPLALHLFAQGSRFEKISAVKYLLVYTLIGSIFLWLPLSFLADFAGSFDYEVMAWVAKTKLSGSLRKLIFLSFFLGFMFKVPAVPFHQWLIVAHVEAPTSGSIILAALLLKIGGYGLYRFVFSMFTAEFFYFSEPILIYLLLGYTYATFMAARQADIKRYVAYTSIAHMNYSMMGLFSGTDVGVYGFIHMTISHGLISTALFFLVGYLYNMTGCRDNSKISGLSENMPNFTLFWFLFSMANMGLPVLSGFPGEFLILSGVIINNWIFGSFMFAGFVQTGVYTLNQLNKMVFVDNKQVLSEIKTKGDLDSEALAVVVCLFIWIVVLGVFPDIVYRTLPVCVV